MEGFVIERDQLHPVIFGYYGEIRLTLTQFGLRKLATDAPALLPDVSEASILDKSKANRFAQVFVRIQAIWFVAVTVGRTTSGLPISLLELNTLLHALCCISQMATIQPASFLAIGWMAWCFVGRRTGWMA